MVIGAQIFIGSWNLLWLAPIFLQLIHLVMADLLWITLDSFCAMSRMLKKNWARIHELKAFPGLDRAWMFTAKTAEGPAQHVVRFGSADDHLVLLQCREGFDAGAGRGDSEACRGYSR